MDLALMAQFLITANLFAARTVLSLEREICTTQFLTVDPDAGPAKLFVKKPLARGLFYY